MARTNNLEKLKEIGLDEKSFSALEATKIFKAALSKLPKKQNIGTIINALNVDEFNYLIKSYFENRVFEGDELTKVKQTFERGFEVVKQIERGRIADRIVELQSQLDKLK